MAIALTEFEAFVGFRPLQEIVDVLHEYPELKELVGSMGNEFINTVSTTSHVGHQKQALKRLFSAIQQSSPDSRTILVQKMMKRIEHKNSRMEMLLKRLNEQYPNDVGLFCALVLNYITLQPGQAIFLAANEPHAYLCGDCIECMATSDNVIRSGFTPKFKDVDTLLDMLTYSFGSADSQITIPTPFPNTNHTLEYNPPIEEFSILFTRLKNQLESIPPIPGPSILIITNGSGWISDGTDEIQCTTGSCFFISQNVALQIHGTLDCYRAFCIINVPLS
jgi:mannose-6-phosphate isomerase